MKVWSAETSRAMATETLMIQRVSADGVPNTDIRYDRFSLMPGPGTPQAMRDARREGRLHASARRHTLGAPATGGAQRGTFQGPLCRTVRQQDGKKPLVPLRHHTRRSYMACTRSA